VLFERHAVGGEYQAGYKTIGAGKVETIFTGVDGSKVTVDSRDLADAENAVVTYHNPLDNVPDLARIFYDRCLLMGVTPYVVTKKTVFKWQEGFWRAMKEVFDKEYKTKYGDQFRYDYAVSREQKNAAGQKMYIQTKMAEYTEELWELMQSPKTHIYMCGLKGMEKGMSECFGDIAEKAGKPWDEFAKQMKKDHRYHVEVY